MGGAESWRPEALRILEDRGYDGVVFVPECRDWSAKPCYDDMINWEHSALNMSDCVLFWVPRELKNMPAFTTNIEFGWWVKSGKIVFGAPKDAPKMDYLRVFADKELVPRFEKLEDTIDAALKFIGEGAERNEGERNVPLMVWRTNSFQDWHLAHKAVGNRLEGAKLEYTFRVGPKKNIAFIWILHANVFIRAEGRNKINEVVLSRPAISSVVLYRRAENLMNTILVLGKEFRTPVANGDCLVWEVAGGSSWKPGGDPIKTAMEEIEEEIGLNLDKDRFTYHGNRQLMATLSAHRAHMFSVELTQEEINWVRTQKGIPKGVIKDSEWVYTEVVTLREILEKNLVDWSNVGMIMAALNQRA